MSKDIEKALKELDEAGLLTKPKNNYADGIENALKELNDKKLLSKQSFFEITNNINNPTTTNFKIHSPK